MQQPNLSYTKLSYNFSNHLVEIGEQREKLTQILFRKMEEVFRKSKKKLDNQCKTLESDYFSE